MKKMLAQLMTVTIILLLFTSCGKNGEPGETTTGEVSGQSTAADTSGAQTTPRDYEVMGGEFVTEYPFERFYVFKDSGSIYRDPKPVSQFVKDSLGTIRIRVTGFLPERIVKHEENNTFTTVYALKIIDAYQGLTQFNAEDEFKIYYNGCPQVQIYRLPTLEIGAEYILLNVGSSLPSDNEFGLPMWLKIREIGGVEYVYPYFLNCDELENNILITDPAEAEIVSDPVVIKYMDDNSIPHPKFEYKFELNDFIEQVKKLR